MEIENILESMIRIKKGAEAEIISGTYLGLDVIIKHRIPKPYRHELIDHKIRNQRISTEAKTLTNARKAGVNVPSLLGIDFANYKLIIQKIPGETLAQYLTTIKEIKNSLPYLKRVGTETGKLHQAGITHGDLSPFNVLLHEQKIFLIDFGLAEFAVSYEKRATDLQTFAQTLEGLDVFHPQLLFEAFKNGYQHSAIKGETVIKQMEKISTRGRYVPRKDRKIS
ncbi:MAG: KEOPS complex kinase/ATPase Bud32 [Candidatus Hodarchaeota archaeon]